MNEETGALVDAHATRLFFVTSSGGGAKSAIVVCLGFFSFASGRRPDRR